jgi:hypothetical protein
MDFVSQEVSEMVNILSGYLEIPYLSVGVGAIPAVFNTELSTTIKP